MIKRPTIVDSAANEIFRNRATSLNYDPDDQWVGDYVNYEWEHSRYIFQRPECDLQNKKVLEFGCNMGATSIVLASLGADVTAIDISKDYIELARLNAKRYGLNNKIRYILIDNSSDLSFGNNYFDYISCNSVLEYVPKKELKNILSELNRVLNFNGIIFILGTSNKLSPREVHSNKWLVNYIPESFDKLIFKDISPERGINPFSIIKFLPNYDNIDLSDNNQNYLKTQELLGSSNLKLYLMKIIGSFAHVFNISLGMLTPNIFLALKKIK